MYKQFHVSFRLLENQQEIVKPDVIIGCDGAHSIVRKHMIRLPMFNFSQTYIDHGYFEINLPSATTTVRKNKIKNNIL